MEFGLLGPFFARADEHEVEVGSRRQERCLLAVLLLAVGQIVSTDRLIDLLWDGRPPDSARGVVHTYVGRLRATLQPFGVRIVTRGGGYVIDADGHSVDTTEFASIAHEAISATEPAERVRLSDRALRLWRGPFLSDVAEEPLRRRLGVELDELRLSSIELRAEAQLSLGRHGHVIADLTALTEHNPTRERLVYSLMIALYRAGRQADALDVYLRTRDVLVSDLGVEPGPELRTAHERILRNDPLLNKPAEPPYAVRFRNQYLPWSVGGHPALEFCNTYAGWGGPQLPGSEWLRSYDALAAWAGYMDLADDPTVTSLIARARLHPDEATTILMEARVLRTHLYSCLTHADDQQAFEVVARFAEDAAKQSVYIRDADGLGRWVLPRSAGLRLPVLAAARCAAELLADPRHHTVRACPSRECGWLFIDLSGMRRWCSAITCGKLDGVREAAQHVAWRGR